MDTTYNSDINTPKDETAAPAFGMKWHNFLIYFSLWAGAILNALIGVVCFTEGMPLYGVVLIGAAVYTVFVRFQLANLKKNAYKHLLAAQLIVIAADLLFVGAEITSVASSVAVCCVTYFYYKKRDNLFVN